MHMQKHIGKKIKRKAMEMFKGYLRSDGRVGIRNQILVISLVQCSNSVAEKIAARCGVPVITVDTGCGDFRDDEERINLGLIRAGQHPNIYAVLLISLGCQWISPTYISAEISACGTKVEHLCIQEQGIENTINKGVAFVRKMQAEGAAIERGDCPISDLRVGIYCGGSDWSSGLAANVVVGECADLFADCGAAFLSSPIRGMAGNERHFVGLAATPEIGNKILDISDAYRRDILQATGQSISEVNPTPGNKHHGITTLCEKAISNLKLYGNRTPLNGILPIGACIPGAGQWIIDNRKGGNDAYACTALAMSGAQICLFTTGLGTPHGNAAAVIVKITANSDTNRRLGGEMIDFDASDVITEGKSIQESSKQLFSKTVEIANGTLSKAELLGDFSWVIPPCGNF